MNRQINSAALDIIKRSESLRLRSYKCPAGILTIGYGHTGKDVLMGQVIDATKAQELLERDLVHFSRGVSVYLENEVTDNQFGALVSLAFNIGLGAFGKSTLLSLVNKGDREGAADQFLRWTKAGGRVLPGLVKRRALERELFLKA
jgi:lysozyme